MLIIWMGLEMESETFVSILLEYFKDKNEFDNTDWVEIEKIISSFSNNHFFIMYPKKRTNKKIF